MVLLLKSRLDSTELIIIQMFSGLSIAVCLLVLYTIFMKVKGKSKQSIGDVVLQHMTV